MGSRRIAPGPGRGPSQVRRLPAAAVGVLIGLVVVAGMRTAPGWETALGMRTHTDVQQLPTGEVSPCLAGSTCMDPDGLPEPQRRLISLVAGERAKRGCRALLLDQRLQRAAQSHAEMIATGGRVSHIDTEQRTPQDRAEAAGYHGRIQENLAVGLATADDVMGMWLDPAVDPSLRTRLDNCAAVMLGVGYSPARASDAYGPGTWVLLLGQPETR
jgi:uncharacterized protein YkwD